MLTRLLSCSLPSPNNTTSKFEVESLSRPDNISTLLALDAQALTVRILIREHRATGIYSLRGDRVEQISLADHLDPWGPFPENGKGLAGALP